MNQIATAFDHDKETQKAAGKALGDSIMGVMLDTVGKLIAGYLQKEVPGYEPFTPSDPEMKAIVGSSCVAGRFLNIWMFLKRCSAVCGVKMITDRRTMSKRIWRLL